MSSRSTTWESDELTRIENVISDDVSGEAESFRSMTWPQQAVFGSEGLTAERDLLLVLLGLVAALIAEAAIGLVGAIWKR